MEPWQEEAFYQRRQEKRRLPRCICCEERLTEDRCLSLAPFGLPGYCCQRCLHSAMVWTCDIEE